MFSFRIEFSLLSHFEQAYIIVVRRLVVTELIINPRVFSAITQLHCFANRKLYHLHCVIFTIKTITSKSYKGCFMYELKEVFFNA